MTVGTFDGVHLGHRAVLEEITDRAARRELHSLLVTFDRHPLTVIRPESAPALLTLPDEKKEILSQTGLDYLAFLPFTRDLSRLSPDDFVRLILVERFRMRDLVIGYDHGFGRSRAGGVETVERLGSELGFGVDVVPAVRVEGRPISSTSVREHVRTGEVAVAAKELGRPYSFRAPVVHGLGRGKDLGFPTANLQVPTGRKLLPKAGIYAVRASLRTEILDGLLHLGPRPTFAGSPPSVELYLLDFDRDIYGQTIRVEFLKRLRDVLPFASSSELVRQMIRDREMAEEYFRTSGR